MTVHMPKEGRQTVLGADYFTVSFDCVALLYSAGAVARSSAFQNPRTSTPAGGHGRVADSPFLRAQSEEPVGRGDLSPLPLSQPCHAAGCFSIAMRLCSVIHSVIHKR